MDSFRSIRIKSLGDLILGILLVALATFCLYLLKELNAGTASQMGPAYFPRMLAIILLLLGGGIVVKSFVVADEHQLRARLLPMIFVIGGTVFFGLAAEELGAFFSVFAIVVIYAFAYPGKRIRQTLFLALGCAVFASVLFVEILALPLTVWPRFLVG